MEKNGKKKKRSLVNVYIVINGCGSAWQLPTKIPQGNGIVLRDFNFLNTTNLLAPRPQPAMGTFCIYKYINIFYDTLFTYNFKWCIIYKLIQISKKGIKFIVWHR